MGAGYGEFHVNSVGSDEGSMFSQYSYIANSNTREKNSDRKYAEDKRNPDRRKNESNPSPKKTGKNKSKESEHKSREKNQNQISSPIAQQTRTSSHKHDQLNPSPYSSLVKVIGNRKKIQKTDTPLSPSSQSQTYNVESQNVQSSTMNEEEDYTYTASESNSPTTKNRGVFSEKSSRGDDESTVSTDVWFISKPTTSTYTL